MQNRGQAGTLLIQNITSLGPNDHFFLWWDENNGTDAGTIYAWTGNGNDHIEGDAESDELIGFGGDDFLIGGDWNNDPENGLPGNWGNDDFTGGDGNDRLLGGAGDDDMSGGTGNDVLIGGGGDDWFQGYTGFDDVRGGGGTDTVFYDSEGSATVDLMSLIANAGSAFGDTFLDVENIVGSNTGGDALYGNNIRNVLSGLGGVDYLYGRGGNDRLEGGGDDDVLIGGTGADELIGGDGSDWANYSTATSSVIADLRDRSFASNAGDAYGDSFDSVPNLFGSNYSDQLRGDDAGNLIRGVIGNDVITGRGGADWLYGMQDNDVIAGDSGIDHMEGGPGSDTLDGGEDVDFIDGGDDADTIDGGTGGDTMRGGSGNDVCYVDNVSDDVRDTSGNADWVYSRLTSYALTDDPNANGGGIENINYVGASSASFTGTGNAAANSIVGWAGADEIDGKGGADLMKGLGGNDRYYVDNAGDVIEELSNRGTADWALVTLSSYTLGENVENLNFLGDSNLDRTGTGNADANTIVGWNGDDILNGGGGADTLDGYGGNDTMTGGTGFDTLNGSGGHDSYTVNRVVDGTTYDLIVEAVGAGTDTAHFTGDAAGQSYTLTDNVEHLVLLGSLTVNGTGNARPNSILGNSATNVLNGREGLDTLTGGLGNDYFLFNTALSAANKDDIADFNVAADTIRLDNAIFTALVGAPGAVLSAGQFNINNANGVALDADDRIIYDQDHGQLWYDSNGSFVGGTIVNFASTTAYLTLTNADFFIV